MVHATNDGPLLSGQRSPKPAPRIWQASEPPFRGYKPADPSGYQKSNTETAIVIDNGRSIATYALYHSLIAIHRVLNSPRWQVEPRILGMLHM